MKKIKGGSQIEIRKAGENEYYFVFMLPSSGIFMSNFFEHLEEALSAAENIKRRAAEENYYLYKNRLKNHFYFVFKIKKNSSIGSPTFFDEGTPIFLKILIARFSASEAPGHRLMLQWIPVMFAKVFLSDFFNFSSSHPFLVPKLASFNKAKSFCSRSEL